jgi:hypothetical protein
MAASSKLMIVEAERRLPVRIRIGAPLQGLGARLDQMRAWLDENCGADGWALTPSGVRGVLNDAISIYFADAMLASAFVARWCIGSKAETMGGVFQVREDEPAGSARAAPNAVSGAVGPTVSSAARRFACLGRLSHQHLPQVGPCRRQTGEDRRQLAVDEAQVALKDDGKRGTVVSGDGEVAALVELSRREAQSP